MGLKDYRKFKLKNLLKEVLEQEFGITQQDLQFLPQALKMIKEGKLNNEPKPVAMSDEEKKRIKEKQDKYMTPDQMFEVFNADIEEFYPNGKPKTTDN